MRTTAETVRFSVPGDLKQDERTLEMRVIFILYFFFIFFILLLSLSLLYSHAFKRSPPDPSGHPPAYCMLISVSLGSRILSYSPTDNNKNKNDSFGLPPPV